MKKLPEVLVGVIVLSSLTLLASALGLAVALLASLFSLVFG